MDHINEISTTEVEKMLQKEQNVVLIDVREDEEVANGIIEGALHIPLKQIPSATDSLDRSKEYILICRSGGRSMKAASYMKEQGFNVTNMTGGMLNWHGEVITK